MAWIFLSKRNESGSECGEVLVNTDLVEFYEEGDGATVANFSSGKARWVSESLDEIAKRRG